MFRQRDVNNVQETFTQCTMARARSGGSNRTTASRNRVHLVPTNRTASSTKPN